VDERIVSIVIDRTFIDAKGVRWIVDFKTSTHEGGALETFLDHELERYRAQLLYYARMVRGVGDEGVRAGLYFPLLRGWREWSP
jgi:ATP-dependent exoDNAse (exonuclease V) beta subunit